MSLTVRVTHENGRVARVQTDLQRPLLPLGRWLSQGDEDKALRSLPLLFSVCGQAHSVAGRLALGVAVTPDQLHLAQLESLREYLIRLMRNWQYPVDAGALGQWMQSLVVGSADAHALEADLGRQLQGWQDLLPNRLAEADWLEAVVTGWRDCFKGIQLNSLHGSQLFEPGQSSVGMSEPGLIELAQTGRDPGIPKSATNELRLAGSGLSHRCEPSTEGALNAAVWLESGLKALINDMHRTAASLSSSLQERAESLSRTCSHGSQHRQRLRATETGIEREGWFKTSRGWLCHRVQMADSGERIGWQIEAPTDVNFAQPELLQRLLADVRLNSSEAKPLVQALVTLIDPCVSCDVETLIL